MAACRRADKELEDLIPTSTTASHANADTNVNNPTDDEENRPNAGEEVVLPPVGRTRSEEEVEEDLEREREALEAEDLQYELRWNDEAF